MDRATIRILRTLLSYVPSPSLLGVREMRDMPRRFARTPHESEFLALKAFRWNRPVVVDVGANRGQTIRSLGLVLDNPSIVAIEPNPHLAAHLQRHFGSTVDVRNLGLSREAGSVELQVPRYGHTLYDTRASTDPAEASSFLSAGSFVGFKAERAGLEAIEVSVTTLDALGLSPQLVKVDVEGMDHLVVEGGRATIGTSRPVLLVERPQPGTVDLLGGLGYVGHRYDPASKSLHPGDLSGLNTLFLSESHLSKLGTSDLRVIAA